MDLEKLISKKCQEIYETYQIFLERKSNGYIFYDVSILSQIDHIVNVDSLNVMYDLSKYIPSLLRLDIYQDKPKHYVALSDFAYSFRNVRFRTEHWHPLQNTINQLDELLMKLTDLCSALFKGTNELTLEEAKAIAWDSLPSVLDYPGCDFVASIKNPFKIPPEDAFFVNEVDQPLFKLRFFKTYLNGICVGWEFFSQE